MRKLFIPATILISLLYVSAFASSKPKSTEGREADITLTRTVHMGGLVLGPGVYTIQHRFAGGAHFLHIQKSELDPYILGNGYPQYNLVDVGDVKCQMEPISRTISQTELSTETRDGSTSVSELSINGEDVVHVVQ